jgi:hypothetical protein
MANIKSKKTRELRIKDVPISIHRKIVAHQKLMAAQANKDVLLDEAAIDLLEKATQSIVPALVA